MTVYPSEYLQNFISGPVIKKDAVLTCLLSQANQLAETALVVHNFAKQTNEYMGIHIEYFVGYSQAEIIKGGIPMLIQLCDAQEIQQLASAQASYIQQTRSTNFDPRSFHMHSYRWTFNHRRGKKVTVISIGVVLTYTLQGALEFGVGFLMDANSSDEKISSCQSILRKVKERHNEIYIHPVREGHNVPYPLNYIINVDHITTREREVLGLLATGISTHKISEALGITDNTVESHRRNLLEKFKAKNSVELIKKASKVFWLE